MSRKSKRWDVDSEIPTFNERTVIDLFQNGIHKHLQIALLRQGLNQKNDDLLNLLRYTIMEEEGDERANKVAAPNYNKP